MSTTSSNSGYDHPSWVSATDYPFVPRYFQSEHGRMHYVDEGLGRPVVMVHGTPTWSFLYRKLISGLTRSHRVIAVDHLGFGLSEKPEDAPYRPEDHARRLDALIAHLGLKRVTLVVHDFGGPIGLSYALDHPENVEAIVLFNTWMWSLAHDARVAKASSMAQAWIGKFLYRRLNISARVLMKLVMGERTALPPEVHRHYLRPFPTPRDRMAPWVLARELAGSSEWFASLWRRREMLRGIPALLLWGMRDPTFGPVYLQRWRETLADAEYMEFPEAGHFVPEESGSELLQRLKRFLDSTPIVRERRRVTRTSPFAELRRVSRRSLHQR